MYIGNNIGYQCSIFLMKSSIKQNSLPILSSELSVLSIKFWETKISRLLGPLTEFDLIYNINSAQMSVILIVYFVYWQLYFFIQKQGKILFMQLTEKQILTVDVENWYDGLPNQEQITSKFDSILEYNLHALLDILQQRKIKATFFWLGSLTTENKLLIREMLDLGHDIGCHGWSHTSINLLGKKKFFSETKRALSTIANITGQAVRYYRAPFFSISKNTPWALPILAENGIIIDSSIVPVRYWRYGFPGFKPEVSIQRTNTGEITELPVSTLKFCGQRIPFAGGTWFRAIPYKLIKREFLHLQQNNIPVVFYIHPWELNPNIPKIRLNPRIGIPHYYNRRGCASKFISLINTFKFTSISSYFS